MADDARWLHPDNPAFGRKCWFCQYPRGKEPQWVAGHVLGWASGMSIEGHLVVEAVVEDDEDRRVRAIDISDISFAEAKPDV